MKSSSCRSLRLLCAGSGLLVLPSLSFAASPGDLVEGFFDGNSIVAVDFAHEEQYAGDLAIDASGRILALSYTFDADVLQSSYLMRLDADGSIDGTFSGNGTAVLDADIIAGGPIMWTVLAPAPDGSVAVFGSLTDTLDPFERQIVAARVGNDGEVDGEAAAFTVSGLTATDFASTLVVQDVHRVPDGGYVAAGSYRYNDGLGGQTDESFIVFVNDELGLRDDVQAIVLKDTTDVAYRDMTVDVDGNVWLLVSAQVDGTTHSIVHKFTSTGSVDAAFADNGQFLVAPDEMTVRKLAVVPSGRLLLAADLAGGGRTVAAFDGNGEVESAYGLNGKAVLGAATDCLVTELKALPDGGVQFVGHVNNGPGLDLDLCVVALDSDGALATEFGEGGMFLLDSGPGEVGWSLSFADNGDLMVLSDSYQLNPDLTSVPILTSHHGLFPDTTPETLAFEDANDVEAGALVTAAAVELHGMAEGTTVPISVEGGEYRISGSEWTDEPGWIASGDQVAVRHTSGASAGNVVETHLTIGGWRADDGESVAGATTTTTFRSTVKPGSTDDGDGGGGSLSLLLLPLLMLGLRRARSA